MFSINPEVIKDLYENDLIVFGTGKVGKAVIPSLARNSSIRLIGVTNSRIGPDDEGIFGGTGLILRSVQSWAKVAPDAAILVAAVSPKPVSEIFTACREAGFQKIIPISSFMNDPIRAATPVNVLAGDPMVQLIGLANEIQETHKASFSEFKGCHRGKTVAVVGAGPTLNYYDQVKGVPHIGVNGAFRKEQLKLDYLFLRHNVPDLYEELKSYSFVKFFAQGDDIIPEFAVEENHARRFFFSSVAPRLHVNIEYYPLAAFGSVIFYALQFAIYTRPKRILLVGCDCTDVGHFYDIGPVDYDDDTSEWLDGYRYLKEFLVQHYPDTEVISVNPVGLKGMFRDVYTENYLDVHPELEREQCEILDLLRN